MLLFRRECKGSEILVPRSLLTLSVYYKIGHALYLQWLLCSHKKYIANECVGTETFIQCRGQEVRFECSLMSSVLSALRIPFSAKHPLLIEWWFFSLMYPLHWVLMVLFFCLFWFNIWGIFVVINLKSYVSAIIFQHQSLVFSSFTISKMLTFHKMIFFLLKR